MNHDMDHLSEDDLVLHYYGEMSAGDESRAVAHLETCPACQAGYARLQRVLAAVDAAREPEPADGFERTVWARLQPAISARPRGGLRWFLAPARLAWGAGIAVLIAAAFLAGRGTRPGAGRDQVRSAERVRQGVLLVDLGDHLDRSQMVLVELINATDAGDIAAERTRAEQLVSDNRLYRTTAAEAGDGALAQLLDELERVLVDVAASPDHSSAQQLDGVRRHIESGGLLFRVRVVSSEVRDRQRAVIQQQRGT